MTLWRLQFDSLNGHISAGVPHLRGLLAVPPPAQRVLTSIELWDLELVHHGECEACHGLIATLRPCRWEHQPCSAEACVLPRLQVAIGVGLGVARARVLLAALARGLGLGACLAPGVP